jgi:hypothetical protein
MEEKVGDGVLLGVFEAVRVAVGSGVFVAVAVEVGVEVAAFVGVVVGVYVIVGGLPVKIKDPDVFHSLPMKTCTS